MDEKSEFLRLIDESIKLEEKMAEMYRFFYKIFLEDKDFWWQLSVEELNHARLFKSARENLEYEEFPYELICSSLTEVNKINWRLDSFIAQYSCRIPTREEAFSTAFLAENESGEKRYQDFMKKESNSLIGYILKELNTIDLDHAKRIKNYMEENKIEFVEIY